MAQLLARIERDSLIANARKKLAPARTVRGDHHDRALRGFGEPEIVMHEGVLQRVVQNRAATDG